MQKFYRHFSALIISLFISSSVFAEEYLTRHIIEISPGIGYYDFDDDRNLEDSAMATIGLGLYLSRRWATLLQYSTLDTTPENSSTPAVDMQKYHVDVHRFFNTEKHLRPYLVAGFGQMDLVASGEKINKNMWNAGVGLYYRMTSSWSVRTDARIFSSTNKDYKDTALTLTLGYRFSGGERGD